MNLIKKLKMEKLEELFKKKEVTNDEAKDFMFAVMDVFVDNEPSETNKSFTNEQCWNILFGAIKDTIDSELINEHTWRNIKNNFSKYSIYVEHLFR